MERILPFLVREFSVPKARAEQIIALIDEGNTIPFIARYRKEMTGSMDDQTLRAFHDRLLYLRNLEARKDDVINTITELEKLTDDLEASIRAATTLAEVEDLYRPYKPKRRTRASMAREKGLAPLADLIFSQGKLDRPMTDIAADYIDEEKGVLTDDDAIAGALDIIAETLSDDAGIRKKLRELALSSGVLSSKGTKDEDSVYALYYEFECPVPKLQGHQILALNRGEREEFLKISFSLPAGRVEGIMLSCVKPGAPTAGLVRQAAEDAYSRLIFPSVERELRGTLTKNASEKAISLFAMNLGNLLMQPPVKGRVVLGLDPAYRTGCKIAVVSETGKVLATTVIYPTPPQKKIEEAKRALSNLIHTHGVDIISIGNGTASKEAELFVAELISELDRSVKYMVVSEAGASVYSASKLAAEEFPEFDVSLRSAVSIARRLQDPLAELVKIEPKAIGVGQYQHDMPGSELEAALDGVVETCVNRVGVDLNTASAPLLARVAGLSASVAKNIVAFRDEAGAFTGRTAIKKVPKLGPKAFTQCAGFLRIPGGTNILDNTGVHPESYDAAKALLSLLGYSLKDVAKGELSDLSERLKQYGEEKAADACGVGLPTLLDIAAELQKPGRDPRDELPPPLLRSDVLAMEDLLPGMELMGTVRNVIDFGAFVDIGVHQDGLVHISELADRFVRHPSDVVSVGDVVSVTVLAVDVAKKRISLSMRQKGGARAAE
ncbi:RNA-binding transcriptional accessory protein [Oscillospiraceae bacterium OttesenSCG-928-G22]|nr:RNA-binding transcriptional accessory protein [Oscillospiraceae bacterium OttesenSCG-928-G22]